MSATPRSHPANRPSQHRLRCAVYTRKSSEEGLDQEFNSLDAQREACSAFIASQVGLGWKLVLDRYDDGGISGGTMERPALLRLLQDIRDKRVDVVVVYKIDRLTRSLADFAKIVEVFDGNGVSFVSVTQQFNTTTSMGRLTLNVLLSFAQFEREVTAERIRDKIAASRKKGMWMGGRVPFGYRVRDRKLAVEPESAEIVRNMFVRLLELGSVGELLAELRRQHPHGVQIESGPGDDDGTAPTLSNSRSKLVLMRGPLTYLLSNPIYIGKVRHHDDVHEGEHEPIIDPQLFGRVQERLQQRSPRRGRSTNSKDVHVLANILFDETGDRLAPTFSTNHGRRYRYYISSRLKVEGRKSVNGWRLPADEIEGFAIRELRAMLQDRKLLSEWVADHRSHARIPDALHRAELISSTFASALPAEKQRLARAVIHQIVIAPNRIVFEITPVAVVDLLVGSEEDGSSLEAHSPHPSEPSGRRAQANDTSVYRFERAATLTRRGQGTRIVVDCPDPREPDDSLVDLIARSHYFLARLTDGSCSSIKGLAAGLGIHRADISRILPLAFLAPSLVEKILTGNQPGILTPAYLRRGIDIPADWSDQRAAILQ